MRKAVLLAGGKGSRLAPYTTVLPKPLMPVGEWPILEIVIRQLKQHGIGEITLCVGYLGSLLEAYFGNGKRWGVSINYSYEEEPLGTAGPIGTLKDFQEPFLVMNGDLLTSLNYSEMFKFHRSRQQQATIGLYEKKYKIDFGVVEMAADQSLKDYIEKPELKKLVSMGIYIFNSDLISYIPQATNWARAARGDQSIRLDLPELMLWMLSQKKSVLGYRGDCEWLDIGNPEDYAVAVDRFEKQRDVFLRKGAGAV